MVSITAAAAAVAMFAGKATSNKWCNHVVIDGTYNLMFQRGWTYNDMIFYFEINPVSGASGKRVIAQSSSNSNLFRLFDKFIDGTGSNSWRMQFAYQYDLGGVCILDNWNRAYQGWNLPWNTWNDDHWAILSGTDASANCIPFPGTIDGEKIEVTSPKVYGTGDCAQAVSLQYPNATGVQVDPWGASWSTKCYAVFGYTKTDQPNNNKAHRACFFRNAVRPRRLAGGTSLDTEFDNVEECVKVAKAHAGAQDAKAVGVTFDKATKECLYHTATEVAATKFGVTELTATNLTAYADQTQEPTQVHVVFSNPLSSQN